MLPSEHYKLLVDQQKITFDDKQANIMVRLDGLYHEICQDSLKVRIKRYFYQEKPAKGYYFWGGVGTGKSFLMDTFYHSLPMANKMRLHFHSFMDLIHYELTIIKTENPLKRIAKLLAKRTKILCLDELLVNDIADAMILAELFEQLLKCGVCLMFTSNTPPERLYQHGIQRDRFIPAIQLIERTCHVVHLDRGIDYRKRSPVNNNQHFLWPSDDKTQQLFWQYYRDYSHSAIIEPGYLEIHKRPVQYLAQNDGVIAFDFLAISDVPRSQRDYLYLAKHYHTILIDGVRPMLEKETNIVLCFIHLIDVLYDHHVRLIIRSQCAIDELYPKGRMILSFARTQSRLIEMQALDWVTPIEPN